MVASSWSPEMRPFGDPRRVGASRSDEDHQRGAHSRRTGHSRVDGRPRAPGTRRVAENDQRICRGDADDRRRPLIHVRSNYRNADERSRPQRRECCATAVRSTDVRAADIRSSASGSRRFRRRSSDAGRTRATESPTGLRVPVTADDESAADATGGSADWRLRSSARANRSCTKRTTSGAPADRAVSRGADDQRRAGRGRRSRHGGSTSDATSGAAAVRRSAAAAAATTVAVDIVSD